MLSYTCAVHDLCTSKTLVNASKHLTKSDKQPVFQSEQGWITPHTRRHTQSPVRAHFPAAPVGGVQCESYSFTLLSHVSKHVVTYRSTYVLLNLSAGLHWSAIT